MRRIGMLLICLVPLTAASCAGRGDPIVGKWEATAEQQKVTLEFTGDGKLHLSGDPRLLAFAFRFAELLSEFRMAPENVPLTYKREGADLEITADLSKLHAGLAGGAKAKLSGTVRESADVEVNPDTLKISKGGKSLKFTRK